MVTFYTLYYKRHIAIGYNSIYIFIWDVMMQHTVTINEQFIRDAAQL